MNRNWWADTSRASWVDYSISWLASSLAAFSCGQAVGSNLVSMLGVLFVTIGTLVSFLMRVLFYGKKWSKVAGTLYSLAAWVAILGVTSLNAAAFPPETFPRELMPSSWLFWMICFGSLFLWRDGVLIFHVIPPLAMFGFVGCYDTFRPVVVLFFIFLVCFAILFARAHARDMQLRAAESGYFKLISNSEIPPEHQSELLREGPWRWAAGAEWALGSALIIVILSALGAPVIQATAKPISGLVPIRSPRIRTAVPSSATPLVETRYTVGTGSVNLSDRPYFEVTGDLGTYYRVAVYDKWLGKSWVKSRVPANVPIFDRQKGTSLSEVDTELRRQQEMPTRKPGQLPNEYRSRVIRINSLFPIDELPQPGSGAFARGDSYVKQDDFGIVSMVTPAKYRMEVYFSPDSDRTPSNAPRLLGGPLKEFLTRSRTSPRLAKLAKEVIANSKTEYDKMLAIQRAVSKRIRYNTKVAATPQSQDPAEYAVFESKEGYCDVFATAVTIMGREAGIPVRYVVGYLADAKNTNDQGTQMLLESDRHAWAEAYFDNIGWVIFDATEGAEVVPGGERRANGQDQSQGRRTLELFLNGMIVASLIVGIAAFIRSRVAIPTAQQVRADLDKSFLSFIAAIWRATGQRRLPSETTQEYLTRIESSLRGNYATAVSLGEKFTTVMFRRSGPTREEVASLNQEVQHFSQQLRAAKSKR